VKTPGGGYHVHVLALRLDLGGKGVLDRKGINGGHIELRYTGHYVNLPPSLHPNGGRYEFVNGVTPSGPPATVSPEDLLAAYDAVTEVKKPPVATPKQSARQLQTTGTSAKHGEAYARAALDSEVANVRSATEGTRNTQLNIAAFALGQLVGGAGLDRSEVERALTDAALAIGLSEEETLATIKSGLDAGIAQPRTIPAPQNGKRDVHASNSRTNEEGLIDDESPEDERSEPTGEGISRNKKKSPSHDELGDSLVKGWDGNVAYFHDQWHRYQDGYWKPEPNIASHIWAVMKAYKILGVKPTKTMASSIEAYLMSQLFVPDEKVDNGADYANLKNGLYNLETDTLEPHRRDLYLTSQLGFAFDPEATCPTWEKCLTEGQSPVH
jgi:putative DNA primase/helicase